MRYLSQDAKDFLMMGMSQNPDFRLSSEEMLEHPFITSTPLPKIKKKHPTSMQ